MAHRTIETDVLIVGGGGAGCRAAIEAHDGGARVLMIVKGKIGLSGCTPYVGTNAAVEQWGTDGDTPASAARDLLSHGGFLGNQEMVKVLTEESPDRIAELMEWGIEFERNDDGSINVFKAAAHTNARNFTLKPIKPNSQENGYLPGLGVMDALMGQIAERDIRTMEDVVLVDLLEADGNVVGATGIDCSTGEFLVFKARATILATGTFSHVFGHTSVSRQETGDGQAAAFRAGAELVGMENTQYIPARTGIPPGGVLVNTEGQQFLRDYGIEEGESRPKEDMVHAIGTELREGRGTEDGNIFIEPAGDTGWDPVYLRNLKTRGSLYPGYEGESVDLDNGRFETAPLAHTTTGGVRVNERCESSIPGLYAAGAVAGGVYGHARPEGFTIMITLVFGRRAGLFAARHALKSEDAHLEDTAVDASLERATSVLAAARSVGTDAAKSEIKATMDESAWIIKDEAGLKAGRSRLGNLADRWRKASSAPGKQAADPDGFEWAAALEASNLLMAAELMLEGALMRQDSRGAFFRADYPEADNDNWLKNLVFKRVDGRTVIDPVPVDLKYHRPDPSRDRPAPRALRAAASRR